MPVGCLAAFLASTHSLPVITSLDTVRRPLGANVPHSRTTDLGVASYYCFLGCAGGINSRANPCLPLTSWGRRGYAFGKPLVLGFLVCKMGLMMIPFSQGCRRERGVNISKALGTPAAQSKANMSFTVVVNFSFLRAAGWQTRL